MAKSKSNPSTAEPVIVEEKRYRGWDMSRVFWGLLLVLIGSLVLLDNLNLVTVDYQNLWQFWPLLIVGWGVALLNITGSWWRIVSAVLMVAVIGLIAWAALDRVSVSTVDYGHQIKEIATDSSADRYDVTVQAGVGKVSIDGADGDRLLKADLTSDFAKLAVDSEIDKGDQKVTISADGNRIWLGGRLTNNLDIDLSRDLPLRLTIDTGASDLEADLSTVRLTGLDIDTGASSNVVTLGNLVDKLNVDLSAGASSVILRVPESSGIRIELDSGISKHDFVGFELKGDDIYETPGYETATKQIVVKADLGASSFEVDRY